MPYDFSNDCVRARAAATTRLALAMLGERARLACRALAFVLVVTSGVSEAGTAPLPVEADAYGKGYRELTTEWVRWMVAIPASSNPVVDPDGAFAAVGQSGKVWFLAGTFDSVPATRSVTVPTGTALFLPVINEFWVNIPEAGDNAWSVDQQAFVRQLLEGIVDGAENLSLVIDGQATSLYRVSGPVGECTLPDGNIFNVTVNAGPHECLADGYWALLPPLSNGHHTIHFTGSIPGLSSLAVTYDITVRGR